MRSHASFPVRTLGYLLILGLSGFPAQSDDWSFEPSASYRIEFVPANPARHTEIKDLYEIPSIRDDDDDDCRTARAAVLQKQAASYDSHVGPWSAREIAKFDCSDFKRAASAWTDWKDAAERRRDAEDAARRQRLADDTAAARQIQTQTDSLRDRFRSANPHLLSDYQRQRLLKQTDPDQLSQEAKDLEAKAREVDGLASKARLNGNWQQARAWNGNARALREHASKLKALSSEATSAQTSAKSQPWNNASAEPPRRQSMTKNLPKWIEGSDAQTSAETAGNIGRGVVGVVGDQLRKSVRGTFESETGLRATVPGQELVNRGKKYVEDAEERTKPLLPLAEKAQRGIEKLGEQMDRHLANPAGAVPRNHDMGGAYRSPPAWLSSPAPATSAGTIPPAPPGSDVQRDLDEFVPNLTRSRGSRFDQPTPAVSEPQSGEPALSVPSAGSRFDDTNRPNPEEGSWWDRLTGRHPTLNKAKLSPTPTHPEKTKDQFGAGRGSRFD